MKKPKESDSQIADLIHDLVTNGCSVDFPEFRRTRAFTVAGSKGKVRLPRGWINAATLIDALQRLKSELIPEATASHDEHCAEHGH